MNTHLQECIYTPENIDHDKGIRWGGSPCICDRLRACEQRVQERYSTYLNADDEGSYSAGYRDGYEFARHTLLTPMQAEQFDAMMEALDNE